jgi:hypothetical protein
VPRNAFRRIRTSQAETCESHERELLIACAHMRTASPSICSCPASGSASSFLPASAPTHHKAFRPSGGQDARCVQPTSATQSNCVHPYLVRSRPAVTTFAVWAPHGVFGSMRYYRGKGRFTSPATASVDRSEHHPSPGIVPGRPRLVWSPRDDQLLRAWALSSHGAWNLSIEPLTPLSPLPLPRSTESLS